MLPDVSLSDQDSGVVDRSSFEVVSKDDGLESSFHELGRSQTQDVIELVLVFVEETESEASSHEGFTFEKSSGILLIKSQEFSCGLSHLGQSELDSPDFSLILETISTDDFKPNMSIGCKRVLFTRCRVFPFRKG